MYFLNPKEISNAMLSCALSNDIFSLAHIWARLYKSLWSGGVQKTIKWKRGELDGLGKVGDSAKCQK